MASNLRVDTILPSTGTTLGIGTAGGTINFLGNSNIVTSGTLNAASATITGNLGVGGVLTYEDVTNIDSIGIVTARLGINLVGNDLNVGSNIKIGNASGIITATSFRGDASQMTGAGLGTDGSANTSGIVTAAAFVPTAGQFFAERNKLINGAMNIMQRGTVTGTDKELTGLGAAASNYTSDHWKLYCQNHPYTTISYNQSREMQLYQGCDPCKQYR